MLRIMKKNGTIKKNGIVKGIIEEEEKTKRSLQEMADLEFAKRLQDEFNREMHYTRSSRRSTAGAKRQTTLDKIIKTSYKVNYNKKFLLLFQVELMVSVHLNCRITIADYLVIEVNNFRNGNRNYILDESTFPIRGLSAYCHLKKKSKWPPGPILNPMTAISFEKE
ncbi:hypothetical protein NQ317_009508, partial [Molorchus minor]